jgi:pyridoxal 5'-phosphate synthase pdxS subunit
MREVQSAMKALTVRGDEELMSAAKELGAPYELVRLVAKSGKLPVPNFAAGGVATPADASLMMALGAEAVFVGSGIFKSSDPKTYALAIVKATTHWDDPQRVLEACKAITAAAMPGLDISKLQPDELLQSRGW